MKDAVTRKTAHSMLANDAFTFTVLRNALQFPVDLKAGKLKYAQFGEKLLAHMEDLVPFALNSREIYPQKLWDTESELLVYFIRIDKIVLFLIFFPIQNSHASIILSQLLKHNVVYILMESETMIGYFLLFHEYILMKLEQITSNVLKNNNISIFFLLFHENENILMKLE